MQEVELPCKRTGEEHRRGWLATAGKTEFVESCLKLDLRECSTLYVPLLELKPAAVRNTDDL